MDDEDGQESTYQEKREKAAQVALKAWLEVRNHIIDNGLTEHPKVGFHLNMTQTALNELHRALMKADESKEGE